MALDTRDKRASAIHLGLPWRGLLPLPDGSIGQADRQMLAGVYSGILAIETGFTVIKADWRAFTTAYETELNDHETRLDAIDEEVDSFVGGSGRTVIDFGAFPGTDTASLDITGQSGLTTASSVKAGILPVATADHSVDEHALDAPLVTVGNIGTGSFTIYARGRSNAEGDLPYGQWTVAWSWEN